MRILTGLLCGVVASICLARVAGPGVVIQTRNGGALVAELQARGLQTIMSSVQEFDNGNTFVMLNKEMDKDFSLPLQDVTIPLPAKMSANDLMEVLLSVYAAKMQYANKINIYSEVPLENVEFSDEELKGAVLPLMHFFAKAGVHEIQVKGQGLFETQPLPVRNPKSSIRSSYYIVGNTHPPLRQEIAGKLGRPSYTYEELLNLNQSLLNSRVYLISPPTLNANASFFQTLSQIHELVTRGAAVQFVSTYLPYARSDVPSFTHGVATQGRLIATLVESLGIEGSAFVRPHARQSLGFFSSPCYEITGRPTINKFLEAQGVGVIVSPDAGFQKDATRYAHELNKHRAADNQVGVVVINKKRQIDGTSEIVNAKGLGEEVKGKIAAIIDDETASGGTMADSAKAVKAAGAKKVIAVVTHLAGHAKKALSSHDIDLFAATDTLPFDESVWQGDLTRKFVKLSIADEVASYIRYLEN